MSWSAVADAYFDEQVRPFLDRFCVECHGGKSTKGKVDFTSIRTDSDLDRSFKLWDSAIELLRAGEMPPDAAKQPDTEAREVIFRWYEKRFIDTVAAHPGFHRPRRLSAREYRNTLHTLFGFDLEVAVIEAEQTRVEKSLVMKLMPIDPPGRSGFKNDTHGNPLTTGIWTQYAYLADLALEQLFKPTRREQLLALTGPIPRTGISRENAGRLLSRFLSGARRRPAASSEIDQAVARSLRHEDPIVGLMAEMKAALLAPSFVYRGLLLTGERDRQIPVDEHELAERLSYFLWNDMPDNQLFELAQTGRLRRELPAQISRMLQSPKLRRFTQDFATQWLALDSMDQFAKRQLPTAVALKSQPVEFLHHLIVDDRPLLELIDSRITFANPLLANFYPRDRKQIAAYRKAKGIELETVPHTRIRLEHTPERGGVLTMPGILAMNRGPIQRGTWILERILGVHLPDPPPDVGQVEPNRGEQQLSFRQRFEKHRENATCAACHNKIDPLGFALQRYDKDGAYRTQNDSKPTRKNRPDSYAGGPIDTSGRLPSGETFRDFAELKQVLRDQKRIEITRNLVIQALSYALCRRLELYDQPTVRDITSTLVERNGTWQDLIRAVVNSLPFQETVIKGTNS